MDIDARLVRDQLDYDHKTGEFRWRINRPRGVRTGDIAGSFDARGYRRISIANKQRQAHRIAWLHFYGVYPEKSIDHINGNVSDNRIENLRLCNDSENQANRKKLSLNTSGFRGVTWHKKCQKWQSAIKVKGKNIHLGLFDDKISASEAYREAAIRHFKDFCCP